jgi:hypothetical protein
MTQDKIKASWLLSLLNCKRHNEELTTIASDWDNDNLITQGRVTAM